MNILLLSFYYAPDLSAGSFRAEALVKALNTQRQDLSITVVTTQPNRYSELSDSLCEVQVSEGVTIRRIPIPAHQSGVLDQVKAFLHYAVKARRIAKEGEWDVVVATSSRLMTALLGAIISRSADAPLYLDVRDLFVDTINDVFHRAVTILVKPVLLVAERFTFRSAKKLNLVSEGFLPYVTKIAPDVEITVLTNGVDQEFIFNSCTSDSENTLGDDPCVVLYAGNVGEGQGLHKVLFDAAIQAGNSAVFRIVGSGGRIRQLQEVAEDLKGKAGASRLEILPPVPRARLIEEYKKADILLVHLNDYDAFKKVLPSKLFEYAATGKPIVAGLSGYAAQFVHAEVEGAAVFTPCDSEGLVKAVKRMRNAPRFLDRNDFCEKYRRTRIMQAMAQDVLALVD